jgi:hypothetical protein
MASLRGRHFEEKLLHSSIRPQQSRPGLDCHPEQCEGLVYGPDLSATIKPPLRRTLVLSVTLFSFRDPLLTSSTDSSF